MKALLKLQGAVIVQAAEHQRVADKLSAQARNFIAVGALATVAAMNTPNAHAQEGVMTPSNCAAVGATVGGILGYALPKSGAGKAIGAALGAFGGGVAGNWACSPKPLPPQDASYNNAANYSGSYTGVGSYAVERTNAGVPLSVSEQDALDRLQTEAAHAKADWKRALYYVDQSRLGGSSRSMMTAALATEAEARREFEAKRDLFAGTVSRLHNGAGGQPRAVGRYLEVSAALLELDTGSRVSYETLAARDDALKARSATYTREMQRAARSYNQ